LVLPHAIPRQTLGPDEVHVWHFNGDRAGHPELLRRFEALLSEDEDQRRRRFANERIRREFVLARGLVRTVLAGYTGADPAGLRFWADAYGKPILAEPPPGPRLHFNLSHSHGVVACAVALGRPVGIDVEGRERALDCLDLADRYFAPQEAAHLRRLAEDDRRADFFAIWTLKEAFVKAIGQGLSFPLDSFAFELDGGRLVGFRPPPSPPGRWQFFQFEPTPRHHGAVAVEAAEAPVRVVMRDWAGGFLSPLSPPGERGRG
jgi:4'-phosphopantetheinyl transferase